MKRVLLLLAIIGCGPSNTIVTDDGGIGATDIQLTVPAMVTVVAGESVAVEVDITAFDVPSPTLTINTSALPDGITCESAVVSVTSSMHTTLTFVASADAAISELPIDVRASFAGKIAGSSPMLLDVSAVAGSLDPTFGDAGVLTLPNTADNPQTINIVQDGSLVVAGVGVSGIFIERFAPDTTPGVPYLLGGSGLSSTAAAIASDGRVAIDAQGSSNNESVYEIDAKNTIIATKQVPSATALAWDGSDLFVATVYDIRRVGPSGDSLLTSGMNIAGLETLAPGTVRAVGVNTSADVALEAFTVDGSTLDPSPYVAIAAADMHALNTVTTPQGTLIGLAGPNGASAIRVDTQGNVLTTYPLDGRWARATEVVALPNGDPLVLGAAQIELGSKNVAAFAGYVVGFDAPFGVLGHTYILGASTLTAGVIDASGQYLYVTGTKSTTSEFRGWVARIRLTSP